MTNLTYDALVLDGVPREGDQHLPTGERMSTSPLTVVLLEGEHDVALVDTPYTYGQIERVRNWILASGKKLKFVYITHGHGDHWLGADELLKSFPGVPIYGTQGTLSRMQTEAIAGRQELWDNVFPGLIPPSPVTAQLVPESGMELEGHALEPVTWGHTDTDDTTGLWVPSTRLLVAGDCIYAGAHQYISETINGGMEGWLAAIGKAESLSPRIVVSGHKAPGAPDAPETIAETRQYLYDVQELLGSASSPREYYTEMLRRHPHHVNPSPVWYGAVALLGGPATK